MAAASPALPNLRLRGLTLLLALSWLCVLTQIPGGALARTATAYEADFARALAEDAIHADVAATLASPRNRALREAQNHDRRIARLASVATEGLSFHPGDLDAILAGLAAAAPAYAPAVGDRLADSFPGFAPQIVARLGTARQAPAAPLPSTWNGGVPPPLPARPSWRAAQAAATAVASIAGNPASIQQAVTRAMAAAPGEERAVLDAIGQAYPGFAAQIEAAGGGIAQVRPMYAATAASTSTDRLRSEQALSAADTSIDAFAERSTDPFDEAAGTAESGASDDPLESFNRAMFAFNDVVDTAVLRPIALGYSTITPDPVIVAIRRFFLNLGAPVIFANDLLQVDLSDAGVTLGRFAINSTVGVLGLFDPAQSFGMERHHADFGQTLHSYGVDSGAYLVLPLLGPSSLRDSVGTAVDSVTNPLFWLLDPVPNLIIGGTKAISVREELLKPLDELKASSVDYYSALKSAYQQNRRVELNKGRAPAGVDTKYDDLFDADLSGAETPGSDEE